MRFIEAREENGIFVLLGLSQVKTIIRCGTLRMGNLLISIEAADNTKYRYGPIPNFYSNQFQYDVVNQDLKKQLNNMKQGVIRFGSLAAIDYDATKLLFSQIRKGGDKGIIKSDFFEEFFINSDQGDMWIKEQNKRSDLFVSVKTESDRIYLKEGK